MDYYRFNEEVNKKYNILKNECKMLTINEIIGRFDIEHILKVMEASMKIKNANKLLNESRYRKYFNDENNW